MKNDDSRCRHLDYARSFFVMLLCLAWHDTVEMARDLSGRDTERERTSTVIPIFRRENEKSEPERD